MRAPVLNVRDLVRRLLDAKVEFVVVGGTAANAHGHIYSTEDLDICAPLDPENIRRLFAAIDDLDPRQRMHPNHPRFPENLSGVKNLYIQTTAGWVDVLGELPGVGSYQDARARAIEMELAGRRCAVVSLDHLIAAKRAAGRPKDLAVLPALEGLQRMSRDPGLFDPSPTGEQQGGGGGG